MNVESKYMVAIAMLSDWLKRKSKLKPCMRDLSALQTCYMYLLGNVIGSACCVLLL